MRLGEHACGENGDNNFGDGKTQYAGRFANSGTHG